MNMIKTNFQRVKKGGMCKIVTPNLNIEPERKKELRIKKSNHNDNFPLMTQGMIT